MFTGKPVKDILQYLDRKRLDGDDGIAIGGVCGIGRLYMTD
jgi:hypothetical protein